jgi:hypothetical protein
VTALSSGDSMAEHPTPETIAAYLSNGLRVPDRVDLETHLEACRECRQEVMSARRLLKARPAPRWQVVIPAAAAAVLVLALLGRGLLTSPTQTFRAVGSDLDAGAAHSIIPVEPANRATVDRTAIVFTWTAPAGRPLYRLTLTDGTGQTIWTANTTDTTIAFPAAATLAPDRRYFWHVDGLDSAGQSMTTGTLQFSTPP